MFGPSHARIIIKPPQRGIPPCVWGPPPLSPPPRIRRNEHVRTVAFYNVSRLFQDTKRLCVELIIYCIFLIQ